MKAIRMSALLGVSGLMLYAGWYFPTFFAAPASQKEIKSGEAVSAMPSINITVRSDLTRPTEAASSSHPIMLIDALEAIQKRNGRPPHDQEPPKVTILDSIKTAQAAAKKPTAEQQAIIDNRPSLLEAIQNAQIAVVNKSESVEPHSLISPFSGGTPMVSSH